MRNLDDVMTDLRMAYELYDSTRNPNLREKYEALINELEDELFNS